MRDVLGIIDMIAVYSASELKFNYYLIYLDNIQEIIFYWEIIFYVILTFLVYSI